MSRHKLLLLLLAIGFLGCLEVSGQARSPFSSFGHGDYYSESLVNNQGMGGAGVSNPQFWYLNNQNPSLLVYNRFTVFGAGVVGESKRIYSDTLKGKSRNGNMNYLVLGFPVLRKKTTGEVLWATSIGLMPYSSVNYSFQYNDTVPGTNTQVQYLDKAEGGFNQFYWSNGVRITKNLNIGLKTAFMFSSVISDYSNVLNDPNQPVPYIINVHELQSVHGVKFMPALSYRLDSIANKYTFNFGLTYDIKMRLGSQLDRIFEKKLLSGNVLHSDTISTNSSKISFPDRLTGGISFGQLDKWMVASDFTFTSYGNSSVSIGADQTPVQNGWKLSLGGELTPDSRSLSSYLKRVTYRLGASTEQGTYLVNGNAVKDFGINFGFSFPVNRLSSLDVAFRTGKRGDKVLNGIEENYFRIYFGVTFTDQWFIKRRFD
jgi:hypothetical protein